MKWADCDRREWENLDGRTILGRRRQPPPQERSVMSRWLLVLLTGLCLAGVITADEPKLETLPAPRPAVVVPVYPVFIQRNPRDVWNYYAVDRQGGFRPRIIYEPGYGPYRAVVGTPFPSLSTDARSVRPVIQN